MCLYPVIINGRINTADANAAALAALHPAADNDSKLSFAAGMGTYHSTKAAALGAFYKPDENIQFSISGTSGHGEHMYNMGVSIALDKVAGTLPTKKKLMQEVDTLNNKLSESEERIASLEKMVMELAARLEKK